MLYLTIKTMEININCDLGEKSKHHSNKYDPDLLEIVNSANVACGFHAGDVESMNQVVKISKKNSVSIGAHPSFNDPENFGRKRMNLSSSEIRKLIIDQYEILQKIANEHGESVTHIKPHGALNNMACEDIELATTLAKAINENGQFVGDGNIYEGGPSHVFYGCENFSGTITINDNAAYTDTLSVTLTLNSADATYMSFSNDSSSFSK